MTTASYENLLDMLGVNALLALFTANFCYIIYFYCGWSYMVLRLCTLGISFRLQLSGGMEF